MPFGLTNNDRANVAFKNIMGRSQTKAEHDLGNEPYGIFLNSSSDNIWTSTISTNRYESIALGIAVEVNADLIVHPNSSNHGYYAVWPTTPPDGIDSKTGSLFVYNTGSLLGINAGDRLLNSIPSTYNANGGQISEFASGYTNRLYSNVGMTSEIDLLDNRDWIFQSQSGIYYEETVTLPIPVKIRSWVYIGMTLKESLSSISGLTDSTYFVTGFTGNFNVVNHNFGKYPNVTILSDDGYEIEGQVKNVSLNSIQVVFNNYNSGGTIICQI